MCCSLPSFLIPIWFLNFSQTKLQDFVCSTTLLQYLISIKKSSMELRNKVAIFIFFIYDFRPLTYYDIVKINLHKQLYMLICKWLLDTM